MSQISIISHNEQLFNKVKAVLEETGHQTLPFNNCDTLIIIEPVLISKEYFTISTFWRIWLEKFSPTTKLITASFFEQKSNPNHIDLTEFPQDFSIFEKRAKPLAEMAEITTLGKDISGKIHKFLDGHGEESLLKIVTELKSLLDTMLFLLMDGSELPQVIEATWQGNGDEQLSQLQKRMEEYQSYFQYLPLWNEYRNALSVINNFIPDTEENIQKFTQTLSGWSEKLRQNFDIQAR